MRGPMPLQHGRGCVDLRRPLGRPWVGRSCRGPWAAQMLPWDPGLLPLPIIALSALGGSRAFSSQGPAQERHF